VGNFPKPKSLTSGPRSMFWQGLRRADAVVVAQGDGCQRPYLLVRRVLGDKVISFIALLLDFDGSGGVFGARP